MTDLREAAQMALETLDNMVKVDWHEWDEFASVEDFVLWAKSRASFTAEALRAALAQPEQEPCIHVNNPKGCYRVRCQLGNKCVNDDMSFRTTPPQREWVGLTLDEIYDSTHGFTRIQKDDWVATDTDIAEFAHIIEARLKAKNT